MRYYDGFVVDDDNGGSGGGNLRGRQERNSDDDPSAARRFGVAHLHPIPSSRIFTIGYFEMSARDKTTFGGVNGKFNALEFFRERHWKSMTGGGTNDYETTMIRRVTS